MILSSKYCTTNCNVFAFSVCLAMLVIPSAARATLGSDSASVFNDQHALGASIKTTAHDGYTDMVLNLPRGGIVHEFINPRGQVFEVTWNTKGSRPDMNRLLGNYFNRFSGKNSGDSPTSRHAAKFDNDFELHSKAMNNYFSGTAHLPAYLPRNLDGPIPLPVDSLK